MSKFSFRLSSTKVNELLVEFCQAICAMKEPEEAAHFLKDFGHHFFFVILLKERRNGNARSYYALFRLSKKPDIKHVSFEISSVYCIVRHRLKNPSLDNIVNIYFYTLEHRSK